MKHRPLPIYDRETGILFTGDSLYPGPALRGRRRLHLPAAFSGHWSIVTQGKIVTHVLGNHIEQTRTAYLDYPIGTVYQPDEHQLELGRAHLLELNRALQDMNGKIERTAFRDFTIWPRSLTPNSHGSSLVLLHGELHRIRCDSFGG